MSTIFAIGLISSLFAISLGCTDQIVVTSISGSPGDLSADLGTYHFSGVDSSNNPYYGHSSSGARFTIKNVETADLVVVYSSTVGSFFSYPTIITTKGSRYIAPSDFFDGNGFDSFIANGAPFSLSIMATLNDCTYIGLDYEYTDCPNYDNTTYSTCDDDIYCDSCQNWGCAPNQCSNGYYKMGLFERCQSCVDIYSNCNSCTDWLGCTACDAGYNLVWDPDCQDEVCK